MNDLLRSVIGVKLRHCSVALERTGRTTRFTVPLIVTRITCAASVGFVATTMACAGPRYALVSTGPEDGVAATRTKPGRTKREYCPVSQ